LVFPVSTYIDSIVVLVDPSYSNISEARNKGEGSKEEDSKAWADSTSTKVSKYVKDFNFRYLLATEPAGSTDSRKVVEEDNKASIGLAEMSKCIQVLKFGRYLRARLRTAKAK
jgi:hypothetical protein